MKETGETAFTRLATRGSLVSKLVTDDFVVSPRGVRECGGDSLAERGRPGEAVLFLFIFRDAEVDMGERGEARCPPEFLEEELLGPVDLERPMGGFSIRALTEDPVSHQTIRDS